MNVKISISLLNINNANPLALRVLRFKNGREDMLMYPLKNLLDKRKKEELNENQFELLVKFLDYKGDSFKDSYFDNLLKIEESINRELFNTSNSNFLNKDLFYNVLDMFDPNEVLKFISNLVTPPDTLPDEFDKEILINGYGTREQTYLKSEYKELAALSVIMKTISGPLSKLSAIKLNVFGEDYLEFSLIPLIINHKAITECPGFNKFVGFVDKSIISYNRSKEEQMVRILNKLLPSDQTNLWLLSVVLFRVIMFSYVLDDSKNKNIITKASKVIKDRLKPTTGPTGIKEKSASISSSMGDDDESSLESFRVVSKRPEGDIAEIEWSCENLDLLIDQHNLDVDDVMFAKKLLDDPDFEITIPQKILASWVTYDVVDSRSLDDIKKEALINILIIAYAWLMKNNYKYLALLVTSKVIDSDDSVFIGQTIKKSRLSIEIKDRLINEFIDLEIYKANEENEILYSIKYLADAFFERKWMLQGSKEYIEGITGNPDRFQVLNPNLKNLLGELILFINKDY